MTMSQPAATDLDEEIGIPPEATLKIPPRLSKPVRLLLIPHPGSPSDLVAVPSGADDGSGSSPGGGSSSSSLAAEARVSSESSLRGDAARCIVVGRQASAADVRIDHKSVSRRHAALHYEHRGGREGSAASRCVLVVRDLGGKHGTHVDGIRLEKNGVVELPLPREGEEGEEHAVRFGNAPVACRLILPAAKSDDGRRSRRPDAAEGGNERTAGDDPPPDKRTVGEDPPADESGGASVIDADAETGDAPSTRETREAQIAAMVASFDSNPVYRKYVPTDEEKVAAEGTGVGATEEKSDGANGDGRVAPRDRAEPNEHSLPITSSIVLSPGSDNFTSSDGTDTPLQSGASVSALCFEPSGARIVAGHRDGTLRFYDFHGMRPPAPPPAGAPAPKETTHPPFRIVNTDNDPLDNTGRHVLTALCPSPSGARWIVGTTSAQAKVLDREGRATLFCFLKGDSYVTDASATKGHTAGVTGVGFHPLERDVSWTCGLDGSVRQWDVSGRARTEFQKLVCARVIGKCKDGRGRRTQVVSNLAVHPGGRKVAVGTACGSVQIWSTHGAGVGARPLGAVRSAHGGANPVTSVTFSGNGKRIASRSASDDTVRVWDVHQMEKTGSLGGKFGGRGREGEHPPSLLIATCGGLPAFNETANCAFGPDGRMLCAGTMADPRARARGSDGSGDACGKLKFFELPAEGKLGSKPSSKNGPAAILEPVEEVDVAPNASVLVVQWHPKLNQIAIGTSDGIIKVFYDPVLSTKGALVPASRAPRRVDGLSDLLRSRAPAGSAAHLGSAGAVIVAPNALPLFREEPRATRKTRERDRMDPEKTRLPMPPVNGGIKTGGSAGVGITWTQHIVQSTNYVNNKNIAGKDPREEWFKYNEGKNYVSKAYEGDIQRILADKTVEEEEADMKAKKRPKTK